MNVKFTAQMEEHLDQVEFNGKKWEDIVDEFYKDFIIHLNEAEIKSESMKGNSQPSGVICSKCGGMMVYRESKFGKFLACSNYPQCKNTQNINDNQPKDLGDCPNCGSHLVERQSKKGNVFYGCTNYPKCNFASWDMPLNTKCPKCNSQLYKHKTAKNERIYCQNQGCNYVKQDED